MYPELKQISQLPVQRFVAAKYVTANARQRIAVLEWYIASIAIYTDTSKSGFEEIRHLVT